MTEHYYSSNPSIKSDKKEWSFTLRNEVFHFVVDRGVFSLKEVDFGSRLLIEGFEEPKVEGKILDVGCGYGPIGLSISKSTDREVDMVDVNERAIELSKENALKNKVDKVSVFMSDMYENVNGTYAAILTNPPIRAGKKVVHTILTEAYDHLVVGGELWVVIQKKQGAPSAIEKLNEVFGSSEVVEKKKGYYLIKSVKVDV